MNRVMKWTAVSVVAAALMASAGAADARVRHVSGTIATQRGVVSGESTLTRGRGFRDRSAVFTGPNGGQRTVEDSRAWNRQAGSYSREHEVTRANGTTRSVDVDAQRTAPGAYTFERDVTGANGKTRTQSGEFTISRDPTP